MLSLEPLRIALESWRLTLEPLRIAMEPWRLTMEPWRLALELWSLSLEPWRLKWEPLEPLGAIQTKLGTKDLSSTSAEKCFIGDLGMRKSNFSLHLSIDLNFRHTSKKLRGVT
jgi:hypothetical protein